MKYTYKGQEYELNLIDTPGHVDFHYEVSRSLACCEGAVLLVDAFQGVEAQTVANAFAAMEHDLTIVPVINKIDLHARPGRRSASRRWSRRWRSTPTKCSAAAARRASALRRRARRRDRARAAADGRSRTASLQAMVFDSHYDEYRGAITYVRVMNGTVRKGPEDQVPASRHDARSARAGPVRAATRRPCEALSAGQVGYLICNIKSLGNVHIGDTVTVADGEPAAALPGYEEPKRMVFCGLYPSDGQDFEQLRDALDKLSINDPSFEFEPETSDALGFGFRCGFLGLLHMEIVQQRLEQEADIDLVQTAPNVTYEILTTSGETLEIHTPQEVPDAGEIEEFRQPIVRVNFVLPTEYIGPS